jgi:Tfp pilus assembly protein PilV
MINLWRHRQKFYGFGLVEALIAVVVITIIGLGLGSLMTSGAKLSRTVTTSSEVENFMSLLGMALSDQPTCTHNLSLLPRGRRCSRSY